MKKHLFGFALFSLIVGMSAFIYAMFNVVRVEEVSAPNYSLTAPAKSCWKMKRKFKESKIGSPIVRQAVFNLARKQINLEVLLNGSENAEVNLPVVFSFFQKDAKGIHYIGSEHNSTISNSLHESDEGLTTRITGSYDWLYNLESYSNLYVVAEFAPTRTGFTKRNFQPEFDAYKAFPVMLDYGK